MLKFENVATPATALTGFVPVSVPPLGFVPIVRVIELVAVVSRLPNWSSTSTCTAGVILAPAVVVVGCVTKLSLVAAAAVMLNPVLVAGARPVLEAANV